MTLRHDSCRKKDQTCWVVHIPKRRGKEGNTCGEKISAHEQKKDLREESQVEVGEEVGRMNQKTGHRETAKFSQTKRGIMVGTWGPSMKGKKRKG